MLEENNFLLGVADSFDNLGEPDKTINDALVVQSVLSLFDTFDERYKTFIQITQSELNPTELNYRIMNSKFIR